MKWLLLIAMVSFVYSDARPVQSIEPPTDMAKPLEELESQLDSVITKLTDLTLKIERL